MRKTENMLPTVAEGIEPAALQMGDDTEQKIFLQQQSGQSRFAPPQYYYPASRSGAVPSWAVSGVQMGSTAAPRHYQPAQ
jgi:hypothetical protein